MFVPVHATCALFHVLRLREGGIKPCKAAILANYLAQYQELRDKGESRADSKKRSVEVVDDIVVGHLESYRTHVLSYSTYVLLYRTMVLMARPTKVRR